MGQGQQQLTRHKLLVCVMAMIVRVCFVGADHLGVAQSEKDNTGGKSSSVGEGTRRKKERRPKTRKASSAKTTNLPDIYRVRVTVIDEHRNPIDDARVWSSVGGEPKRVEGGWQFDIPRASMPLDGKVTFYAAKQSAFSRGDKEISLSNDPNPAVTIPLRREYVTVRGAVRDEAGKSIAGARVSVNGYEAEAVITQFDGGFVLPAHAADGQQVYLHLEAAKYKTVNRWHPAGDTPAIIVLEKE